MNDDAAKANLYDYLKHEREAVLSKLDVLSEYDVRRPLTVTGTNLLGLVKHLATWEARYLGEVFHRPFPEPLPRWDIEAERLADMWATEHQSRSSWPCHPRPRGGMASCSAAGQPSAETVRCRSLRCRVESVVWKLVPCRWPIQRRALARQLGEEADRWIKNIRCKHELRAVVIALGRLGIPEIAARHGNSVASAHPPSHCLSARHPLPDRTRSQCMQGAPIPVTDR